MEDILLLLGSIICWKPALKQSDAGNDTTNRRISSPEQTLSDDHVVLLLASRLRRRCDMLFLRVNFRSFPMVKPFSNALTRCQ